MPRHMPWPPCHALTALAVALELGLALTALVLWGGLAFQAETGSEALMRAIQNYLQTGSGGKAGTLSRG
jgi:hypothetical protein